MEEVAVEGGCPCGNLSVALCWRGKPSDLAGQTCSCRFCSQHGASWAAIPTGRLSIHASSPTHVSRHTFGTHTAVFHVCARCGVVAASTSEIEGRVYGAVNVRVLSNMRSDDSIRGAPGDFADETTDLRLARRKRTWISHVRFAPGSGELVDAGSARAFRTSRTVLFGDCDPGGVIYTPRVAHFVAEAAIAFMSERLGVSAARYAMESGVLPPARVLSIEYLQFMTYDERIEIGVHPEHVGRRSFTLALSGHKADRSVAFRARLVQVCVSAKTGRTTELPEEIREKLAC